MNKMTLKDGTELNIKDGASLSEITIETADFTVLGTVANSLLAAGNLDNVKFEQDGQTTGEYEKMKIEAPLFRSVDIVGGNVQATISIREKTEIELEIEMLQKGQELQDGAIADLGEVVGNMAEGGVA